MDFCYTMTFLQCVHSVYDKKMEAVYRKSSRKGSFGEDTESTLLCTLGIFYSEDSGNALFRFFVNLFFFSLILLLACFIFAFLVSAFGMPCYCCSSSAFDLRVFIFLPQ